MAESAKTTWGLETTSAVFTLETTSAAFTLETTADAWGEFQEGTPVVTDKRLLESGSFRLLESGDKRIPG